MKIVETHGHSDECSGMYLMDDGTRIYWSEGRSSSLDILYPDGRHERVPVYVDHQMNALLEKAAETGETGKHRQMTPMEELYHEEIRSRR